MNKKETYTENIRMEQAKIWGNKRPLLGGLDIELTERCNNNCIHCYINLPGDDSDSKKQELSTQKIEDILTEAASLGLLTVRFTGGEPLLRRDFHDIYLFARQLGLKVRLFTNATLITSQLAETFSKIPPMEKIEVTVYGMSKKTYEAVTRSPGSFKAAFKGINLLLKKGIPFVVKGAILPPNREEVAVFDRWASTLPWMNKPPSYSMFFDLRGHRDSDRKNEMIKKLRLSAQEALTILSRNNTDYFKNVQEFCCQFLRPPNDILFNCGSGERSGCVNAYGYFQPCILLRDPSCIYDLKKGTLQGALTRFFPELRTKKASNPDYLSRCARCFLQGLCEQCPAKSWLEYGTLDRPVDYLCEIAHVQARYLGLLANGEMAWTVHDWEERVKRLRSQKHATNNFKQEKPG